MEQRWANLAHRLAETGIWNGLGEAARAEQIRRVTGGEYPLNLDFLEDATFNADGEELAEGGVEDLLRAMAPALRRHGVELQVDSSNDPNDEDDYVVYINGRRCVIRGRLDDRAADWYAATVRPLVVVNHLLQQAAAPVRAYTLYAGGNEGLILLLEQRVADTMKASRLFDEKDIPALATPV